MGAIAKGKKQVTGLVSEAQHDYIAARGLRLGWSTHKAVTQIVALWFESGCPPLSHPDALLPRLEFEEAPAEDEAPAPPVEVRTRVSASPQRR
jgi:hypothetical protein